MNVDYSPIAEYYYDPIRCVKPSSIVTYEVSGLQTNILKYTCNPLHDHHKHY